MQDVFSVLKEPDHFLERHALFVQTNHILKEYHSGFIALTNQTPFEFWQPVVLHALYHATNLLKSLLLSCQTDDFQGWMYDFRLPPKACERLGIRHGSIDQIVMFWKALFSVRLFMLCDHLLSFPPSEWSQLPVSPLVDLKDVLLFLDAKDKWWSRLKRWDGLVQSGKCRISFCQ